MAYTVVQTQPAYKNFQVIVGNPGPLYVKVEPYDEEAEFDCKVRSRTTGSVQTWTTWKVGSNAGYLQINVPGDLFAEDRGFEYQVIQTLNGEETVVATGKIEELGSEFTSGV